MALQTPRELFIHELSDAISAEHIVRKMLDALEQATKHADVRKAVTQHQQETDDQIVNLEKIFELLDTKAEDTTCHAAAGLKQEHHEIATCITLHQMAKELGEKEVADLLDENLTQEKEMARSVQSLIKDLGKDAQAEMKEMEQARA